MKTLSEMAPIDMEDDDSMLIAVRQILWFKENGFNLSTVRALVGLPSDPKASWDETCEGMAQIWESMARGG